MNEVLSISGLCKTYSTTVAVDSVSFAVRRNEIVGLLGPNGAGKTTTISMILGVLEPDAGSITIEGLDIAKQRRQAMAHTNFSAAYSPLPGNLTVHQNLRIFGLIYSIANLNYRIEELLEQYDLQSFRDVKVGLLSSGEQARVSLAKAMLNQPRLLLLDEPTASLDPSVANDIRERICTFAQENSVGVLWTSHNMYEVEKVCNRVLFLSHGRILMEGDPRSLPHLHGKDSLEELFIHLAREPLGVGADTDAL